MIAVVLSILFPGLGQLYLGKWVRASLMILLGVTPLYPAALVWSAVDAFRLSRAGAQPQFSGRETVAAIVLFLVVAPLCLFVLAFSAASGLSWAKDRYLDAAATEEEGGAIMASLLEYRSQKGRYPDSLAKLAEGRPLRADWLTDGWGRPYEYQLSEDGRRVRLTSGGRDGRTGTPDDVSWEQ